MKIKVNNPQNAPFRSKGILIEPIDVLGFWGGWRGRSAGTVVDEIEYLVNMSAIASRSPNLNVVSLCPLRYGIGWRQ